MSYNNYPKAEWSSGIEQTFKFEPSNYPPSLLILINKPTVGTLSLIVIPYYSFFANYITDNNKNKKRVKSYLQSDKKNNYPSLIGYDQNPSKYQNVIWIFYGENLFKDIKDKFSEISKLKGEEYDFEYEGIEKPNGKLSINLTGLHYWMLSQSLPLNRYGKESIYFRMRMDNETADLSKKIVKSLSRKNKNDWILKLDFINNKKFNFEYEYLQSSTNCLNKLNQNKVFNELKKNIENNNIQWTNVKNNYLVKHPNYESLGELTQLSVLINITTDEISNWNIGFQSFMTALADQSIEVSFITANETAGRTVDEKNVDPPVVNGSKQDAIEYISGIEKKIDVIIERYNLIMNLISNDSAGNPLDPGKVPMPYLEFGGHADLQGHGTYDNQTLSEDRARNFYEQHKKKLSKDLQETVIIKGYSDLECDSNEPNPRFVPTNEDIARNEKACRACRRITVRMK